MGTLDHISNLCYIAKGEHGLRGVIQYAYSMIHPETKVRPEKKQDHAKARNLETIAQYTH
ncbi:MAG: hypothetical protein AABW88_04450 [Nanoarchaeota archaeon]